MVNSNVTGASVYHGTPEGKYSYLGKTPLVTKVRGARKYITVQKEGYTTGQVKVHRAFNPVVILDVIYPFAFAFDKYYRWTQKEYTVNLDKDTNYTPPTINTVPRTTQQVTTESIPPQPKELRPSAATVSQIVISKNQQKMTGKAIYKKYCSAVFMVFTGTDQVAYQGSGFFVNSNGLAVSNYHNFQGTFKGYEMIKTTDGNTYKVKEVLAYSEKYDYILFKVDGTNFNYIPVGTRKYEIADKVFAIGSPLGMENTYSEGTISQIRENSQYKIQINVPIDHGSSGGALINEYGEVIGITSAGRADSGANLNFAQDIQYVLSTNY